MNTYKITVLGWEKHNGNKKKGHRSFLLETRFFEDEKISQLRLIEVVLFLKCLCIAGELMSSQFTIHAGLMPKRWRINDKLLQDCCETLQSFQLVTYEKVESLKNRIEKNRIEKNRNRISTAVENSTSMPPQLVPAVVEKVSKKTGAIFELEHDQTAFTLLQDVTKDLQTKWLAAYPSPDWIVHEIKKADVWMTANPSKRPKNFGRFMSGWLAKGFESYRKGLPTNQKTYSQKNADALSEMLQMVDEGTL